MSDKTEQAPRAILGLLADAARKVGVVAKTERNKFHKYNFRGIDAVHNAFGPVFSELGIVMSNTMKTWSLEHGETADHKPQWDATAHVVLKFTAPDGTSHETEGLGQSSDTSDKALMQAVSQAVKYGILHGLCTPSGETDPDAKSPEAPARSTGGSRGGGGRQPNNYGGKCQHCDTWNDEQAGYAVNVGGKWKVECKVCPTKSGPTGTADPAENAAGDDAGWGDGSNVGPGAAGGDLASFTAALRAKADKASFIGHTMKHAESWTSLGNDDRRQFGVVFADECKRHGVNADALWAQAMTAVGS